jgi:uncharacterized membrane protein
MNATHFHLLSTHLPIFGTLIGMGILAYGILYKKTEAHKIALVIFILIALATIPVFFSGEEAEETVENIAAVSEQTVENHEELAEKVVWLMYGLGALALINLLLIVKKSSSVRAVSILTLIVSMITFGFFAQVGNLGGQIRHTEINNTENPSQQVNDEENHHEESEANDDD